MNLETGVNVPTSQSKQTVLENFTNTTTLSLIASSRTSVSVRSLSHDSLGKPLDGAAFNSSALYVHKLWHFCLKALRVSEVGGDNNTKTINTTKTQYDGLGLCLRSYLKSLTWNSKLKEKKKQKNVQKTAYVYDCLRQCFCLGSEEADYTADHCLFHISFNPDHDLSITVPKWLIL